MKKFLAIALALVMAISLVACAKPNNNNGGETSNDIAGTYDITVWVAEAAVELTKKQIDNFNATNKLGITFNATIQPVSEADAATQMITDVDAGGDLFCFAQDQFARLVQAGALSKLGTGATTTVKDANDASVVSAAALGDELWAYPLTSDNGYFMYYDKSVIPEDHVDSLESLISDCEAAKRYFAFELNNAWYAAGFFFGTGCTSVWTTDNDGQYIDIKDTFNSPEGLIAVKGMKMLADSEYHVNSSKGAEFDAAEKAAIVVSGTWDYETVKGILGDNMGVADLPSFTVDGKEYHIGSFNGCKLMGVKPQTDAKKLAAVHQLAQYLTGEECQMERFNELSWGPSNKNAQASDAVQANPGLAALLAQAPYSVPQGQIHGSWWDIAKVIYDDVKAATDEAGLQAALDNYLTKIKALFNMSEDEKEAWSVIGSIQGTSWDTDFPMTKVSEGVYESDAMELHAGEELKVRQGASWDVNYGTTGLGGDNLVVEADGTYKVHLDIAAETISLVPAN